MQPPTSRYGCGSDECQACSGDKEWQEMKEREWLEENGEEGELEAYDDYR